MAEHLSSEIDMAAAAQFLPPGKKFDDMDPFEVLRFLGGLTPEQLKQVSTRVLPSMDDWVKIDQHWLAIGNAYGDGKYEAALMAMTVFADEVGQNLNKVLGYRQRVNEGASVAVKGLVLVREACHLALTVMGGMVGGKLAAGGSRLLGAALGSAGSAGGSTVLFETAGQLAEGHLDPGAILWKGGKDAVITFITTYIGGGLADKFKGALDARLLQFLPKLSEGARALIAARLADVTSGVLTAPVGIVVDGMLGGDWPTSAEDLCNKVAKAAAFQVAMGQAMEFVAPGATRGPEGEGQAPPGEPRAAAPGNENPFADLSEAEIDAALSGMGEAGTMVQGPGGEPTAQSLVDMEVVSRLNDEVRALVAGRGVVEPPVEGPALERSEAEVAAARQVLEDPNSAPESINQAIEVIVERAVADFRARWPHAQAELGASPGLTADALRGACGVGRDITADSLASLTVGSQSPVIIHRIQANHLDIGARHAFNVIILADGGGYIVDPTFAQFSDQVGGETFTAEGMLAEPEAAAVARDLLQDGFIPLTPENARAYALGLGAPPEQAAAVAERIMAGDASILTEVVVNGTVRRTSGRVAEAYNTLLMPRDPDTPSSSSINGLDRILGRLPPTDPVRPMLVSLRDRLLMISAVQPQVTAAGIRPPPGGRR